jgi:hypothetical protein
VSLCTCRSVSLVLQSTAQCVYSALLPVYYHMLHDLAAFLTSSITVTDVPNAPLFVISFCCEQQVRRLVVATILSNCSDALVHERAFQVGNSFMSNTIKYSLHARTCSYCCTLTSQLLAINHRSVHSWLYTHGLRSYCLIYCSCCIQTTNS